MIHQEQLHPSLEGLSRTHQVTVGSMADIMIRFMLIKNGFLFKRLTRGFID
jgi:hypothetical protein